MGPFDQTVVVLGDRPGQAGGPVDDRSRGGRDEQPGGGHVLTPGPAALVELRGSLVQQTRGQFTLRGQVRESEADGLGVGHRPAEEPALTGAVDGVPGQRANEAQPGRAAEDPVQCRQQRLGPGRGAADAAQYGVVRDPAARQDQPAPRAGAHRGRCGVVDQQAGGVAVHDEGRPAAVLVRGDDQEVVGDGGPHHEVQLAGEDPVARSGGGGAGRDGGGKGRPVRLTQRHGAQPVARGHPGQVALPLPGAAEGPQWHGGEHRVDAEREDEARVAGSLAEPLQERAGLGGGKAAATQLTRYQRTGEAQLGPAGEFGEERRVPPALAVAVGHSRPGHPVREFPGLLHQRQLGTVGTGADQGIRKSHSGPSLSPFRGPRSMRRLNGGEARHR